MIQYRDGENDLKINIHQPLLLLDDDEGVGVGRHSLGHGDGVQEGGQDELHLGRDPGR